MLNVYTWQHPGSMLWHCINCILRIGTVGIRDLRRSLNYHHLQRIYELPTGNCNLKVDLSHVSVGELSAELEIAQDIKSSACHIPSALPKFHYQTT